MASTISFVLNDGQQLQGGLPLTLPLAVVRGVSAGTDMKAATCLLQMHEKQLELSFKPTSAFGAIQKEHIKARDHFMHLMLSALAVSKVSELQAACGSPCAAPAPAATTSGPPPSKTTARMRKGQELRELLKRVSKLASVGKDKAAKELLESAAAGSGGSSALADKRVQQLQAELFTYGGLELTKSIVAKFLQLPS